MLHVLHETPVDGVDGGTVIEHYLSSAIVDGDHEDCELSLVVLLFLLPSGSM